MVPPFLSLGIFIIIFSASQRDEQNSCMEYKADGWTALIVTFTFKVNEGGGGRQTVDFSSFGYCFLKEGVAISFLLLSLIVQVPIWRA